MICHWGPESHNLSQLFYAPSSSAMASRIDISSGAVIRMPFPEGQPYAAAW
jgi:hypothetical protein